MDRRPTTDPDCSPPSWIAPAAAAPPLGKRDGSGMAEVREGSPRRGSVIPGWGAAVLCGGSAACLPGERLAVPGRGAGSSCFDLFVFLFFAAGLGVFARGGVSGLGRAGEGVHHSVGWWVGAGGVLCLPV